MSEPSDLKKPRAASDRIVDDEPATLTTFTIRPATAADLPALHQVMNAAIDKLQQGFLSLGQIAASHAIMGVDTALVDDGTYLVVECEGEIAGCGGWSRRATLYGGDHTAGRDDALLNPAVDAARVRAMYTDPRFARQGVGRSILDGCQRAAAAEGFSRLELVATLAGQPLYQSFGFEPDEHFTDDTGGTAVPLVRMSKAIPKGADALSRYQALFEIDTDLVAEAATGCLAPNVVFESARLHRPVVGREAAVKHVLAIRDQIIGLEVRHTTTIARAGHSHRWCWSLGTGTATTKGMDVATLTADGLIARIAVFDRPMPPRTVA